MYIQMLKGHELYSVIPPIFTRRETEQLRRMVVMLDRKSKGSIGVVLYC